MNVKSKENRENSAVELVIQVDGAEFDAAVNKVYNRQKGRINVPGFRKGKAPRRIIEAMFGSGVFYEDAIEAVYPKAYSEALEQEGIKPVAFPQMEVLEVGPEGFTFKALVTVRPEAKLGEYKGLSAPKDEVKVTEEDIDGELKTYIDRATRLVSVERPAQTGDTVVIDFEGFRDGTPFEGGKAEKYSLELGSGSFIPGFEEQVAGMSIGEERELNVTFPEDYAAELAGAAVVFKVKLHEVKEHQKPEVDDEFAKDVSEFDTLAQLREDLGSKLRQRREAQADQAFENAVLEQLTDNLEVELPQAMVDYRAEKQIQDYRMRLESQGIKLENYLSMMGMSAADMRMQFTESARRQLRLELALEEVVRAEGLEATEEDCAHEVEHLAQEYKMEAEQVKAAVQEEDLKRDVVMRKARQLVLDAAKVGKAPQKAAKKDPEDGSAEDGEKKPARKRTAKRAQGEEPEAGKAEEGEKKPTRRRTAKKVQEEPQAEQTQD